MTIAFIRERGRILVLCDGEGPVSLGEMRRTPSGPVVQWADEESRRRACEPEPTILEAFLAWQASEGEES